MAALESLKIYKNIFNKLPVAIFVADTSSGNIVDANHRACKLINRTYEEVINLHQSQLHPPVGSSEMKHTFKSHIEDLLAGRDVEDVEHMVYDSHGNLIPVEISPTLVEVEGKNLVVGMFKDLRKRKERENLLSYYDKALKKSSSLLAFVDSNYIYQSVNDAYCSIFGKEKNEIIGHSLLEILGKEYFDSIIKKKFELALSGQSIEYESTLVINNKEVYLQVYYEPYYSVIDEIIGVVINVSDLTRYKKYEQENIKKEKLLIQQSKMAAMGEMLENIAHQWRQPLSVISTCTSGIMLQKEFDTLNDEILNDSLKNIMNTTSYLSNTIDDFKNFFERDKQKSEFNVNDLIDKTIDLVEMSFSSNDIELIKDFNDSININSYKNELMQVLLNIINNAKDALLSNNNDLETKKIISISLYKNKDKIVIDIRDNAGGIPEDIKDKIFEPYFTTKHQSQGTGIGLFMTQEIVKKHMEGEILIKNESFKYENEELFGALFRIII